MTEPAKQLDTTPIPPEEELWLEKGWRLGALLMLLQVLGVAIGLCLLFPIRFDLSFPEGALIARVMDVAAGRTPYTDWRLWPHGFAPYGPLTYYPPGWIARGLHDAPGLMDYYVLGRAHSLLFLTGIWVLIGGLGRRLAFTWTAVMIPVGIFTFWRWLQEFAFSFRPDAPQVFFALLALWAAMGGRATRGRILAVLAALMASFWYKPTSWGIVFALGFWMAGSLGYARAAGVFVGFGLTGLVAALVFNAWLDGALILNMLGVTDVGWEPMRLIAKRDDFPFFPSAVLIASIGISVYLLRRARGETRERERLLAQAYLFTLAFALVQYAKAGADRNYFLESYAIASVLSIWALREAMSRIAPALGKRVVAAGLLVILLVATGGTLRGLREERVRSERLSHELPGLEHLARDGQLVLAYHPYLSLRLGDQPSILDAFQFMRLVDANPEIESPLLDRVRRREFDLIVIPINAAYLYSDEFLPLLAKHYEKDGLLGPNIVYTPLHQRGKMPQD